MRRERFIAQSRVMPALVEQVRRFVRTDSNALITGETRSGTNAVARVLGISGKALWEERRRYGLE